MLRRTFMMRSAIIVAAFGTSLVGCTTILEPEFQSMHCSKREIDSDIDAIITRMQKMTLSMEKIISKAYGILIFPSVISAGFIFGGQYGEGALRIGNISKNYYNLLSASVGLQIGAQSKAVGFLFMTRESLDQFIESKGWVVGADVSVAILKVGSNVMLTFLQLTMTRQLWHSH